MKTHAILKSATAVVATGILLGATPALAQGIGFVGLSYGYNDGENPNDNEQDISNSGTLDGAYALGVGANGTLVVEGSIRSDSYAPFMTTGDEMEPQFQIALHYLFGLNPDLKVGAFASYGRAPHVVANEQYDVVNAGLEAIYNMGAMTILFGQLSFGDSPDNAGLSSAGYQGGRSLRLGATYTGLANTAVTLDMEIADSEAYEDDDEPGAFYAVALSGETNMAFNPNLMATYGVRFAEFSAEPDPDFIRETSFNIGVRYLFGATGTPGELQRAGIIGLPYTPLRASAWTPAMD